MSGHESVGVPARDGSLQRRGALAFLSLMLLLGGIHAVVDFADPDMWHEMAHVRESLERGGILREEIFAFTRTVEPVVHHEWGTGALLLATLTWAGEDGLLLLRFALGVGIVAACAIVARRRGASWPVLCALLPAAMILLGPGFSVIRAQMFTLLFLAVLFGFLTADEQGRRWWIAACLPLFVLWLNLHAGFVVGGILLGAWTVERAVRGLPVLHLLATLAAIAALVLVNPYGIDYVPYLWEALRMERPLITEWRPVWQAHALVIAVYVSALLVVVYAAIRKGVRNLPGLLIVALVAYAGLRHQRHLTIFGVAWVCFVPAYLEGTRLSELIVGLWRKRPRLVAALYLALGLSGLVGMAVRNPWQVRLPANADDRTVLRYPVGAVRYLNETGFAGRLVTPFEVGAFVSWNLHPRVLVSLDGRYELAYEPEMLNEHILFFRGEGDWRTLLERYSPDAILVPQERPVREKLAASNEWRVVYQDDLFVLFVASSLESRSVLPLRDRRGERISDAFWHVPLIETTPAVRAP